MCSWCEVINWLVWGWIHVEGYWLVIHNTKLNLKKKIWRELFIYLISLLDRRREFVIVGCFVGKDKLKGKL